MAVNWSDLPQELVACIARRVVSMEDFTAFGAVCKSWRSAATKENFTSRFTRCFPLLMLQTDAREDDFIYKVYNINKQKSYQVCLPGGDKAWSACFSCRGWLFKVSEDLKVSLWHPLNGALIKLPDIDQVNGIKRVSGLRWFNVTKFALSASPSWTTDYIVTAIYYMKGWAFWRPGEDKWTCTPTEGIKIEDVIYYKDQFYALDSKGSILVCDFEDPYTPNVRIVVSPLASEFDFTGLLLYMHLVESDGALLVVLHALRNYQSTGTDFRVFEVPFRAGNLWRDLEVKSLGNRTMFLGGKYGCCSFCVEASNYSGCKANCIYVTERLWTSKSKRGPRPTSLASIFNMEDRQIELLYKDAYEPRLWIEPSF